MRISMMTASGDPHGRARDIYQSAIKSYPETLQVRVEWISRSHPKWEGSVKQLEAVIDEAKTLPKKDDLRYISYLVYEEIGSAYEYADNRKRAAASYAKAIPLCPGLDQSLTRLISLQQDAKDHDALVPAVDQYIERYPRSGWAYAVRGWSFQQRNKWPEAVRDYEKSSQLGNAAGYEGLAWLTEWGYGVKHDYRRAIELYEIAAENGSKTAKQKADNIRKGAGIQMR
jgi:tetratricopeptide (TPR) repeat protein